MKKLVALFALGALLLNTSPAWAAASSSNPAAGSPSNCYCQPPRFQIFNAMGKYGGLIMLDTKTGESFQRVIVNTANGIDIKWIKLERVKKMPANQTIVWD